MTTNL